MPHWSLNPNSLHATSKQWANTALDKANTNRPSSAASSSAADYAIPALHRTPRTASPDSFSSTHTRSSSNPFPSFFGGGKRISAKKSAQWQDHHRFDSTDDTISINSVDTGRPTFSSKTPSRNSSVNVDKEPVTGKCMTCDSTVRWPKALKVYRCTICLTINDLEPYQEPKGNHDGSETYTSFHVPRKSLPISVARSQAIIDDCITNYLQSRLNEIPLSSRSVQPSPPESPIFDDQNVPEGLLFSQAINRESRPPIRSVPTSRPPTLSPSSTPQLTPWSPPDSPSLPGDRFRHSDGTMSPPRVPDQKRQSAPGITHLSPRVGNGFVPNLLPFDDVGRPGSDNEDGPKHATASSAIFRPLEKYISECFTGCATLNTSFFTVKPQANDSSIRTILEEHFTPLNEDIARLSNDPLSEVDGKTLLLGDFAENGSWWAGSRGEQKPSQTDRSRDKSGETWRGVVNLKTPRINWTELAEWYRLVVHPSESWRTKWQSMRPIGHDQRSLTIAARWDAISMDELALAMTESKVHAQRALLKSTENLLKRPRRPLKQPEDCRFLLILLANPLLYSGNTIRREPSQNNKFRVDTSQPSATNGERRPLNKQDPTKRVGGPGHHSGIIKRILGLISNFPNEIHQFLVSWFSRFSDSHFQRLVDLVGSFVTYRLSHQSDRKRNEFINPTEGLVPSFAGTVRHPAHVHAALGVRPSSSSKSADGKPQCASYGEDWQVRAAARVMALLFTANNGHPSRKRDAAVPFDQRMQSAGLNAKYHASSHGQIIPISTFYNTLLDYADLVADFEAWETNRGKFSFCQYPFFLSIWAKIHILEHDARRQMEVKAREAFFDSILSRKAVSQYLVLKVRRNCLVEDSLRRVSEVVGSGQEEIKKGLRIDFVGEEGVDAGGLRKEWFLLLVREIFDPHHGLFLYDEDSQYCYFNPSCFESSEQFFLVGVLMGLAIYNSTILDVAFPPFAFKKLLASAPTTTAPTVSTPRLTHSYTLDDLAEYRPALARGLRQLLEYDGDVQTTFCRDFIAEIDRYGDIEQVALCPGGEKKPVTNSNRREFVDLYIRFLLDTSVARQFEPFKRGFFTVCGGNALSLFRPEEIELLIRGSEEPLDVSSLRAVAIYEGWPNGNMKPESQPQVLWFWEFFEKASATDQRKILGFITGSDRIPAMGATNLVIRVVLLGMGKNGVASDTNRFPSARTCFNMLMLYAYESRKKLEKRLWMAVCGSEGFGLK